MTANLVTGAGAMGDLLSKVAVNVNSSSNSSGTDFGAVLKNSTDASKDAPQTENVADRNVSETPKDVAEAQKPAETPENVKRTEVSDDTKELSDEQMEQVEEVAAQMVQTIADVLGVTIEDVEVTLDEVGISDIELLNPDVIPQVVVQVTDATDVMDIMTDEQLFSDVKELMTEAEDLMDQLSQELKIPVENLSKQIQNVVETTKDVQNVVKEDDSVEITFTSKEEVAELNLNTDEVVAKTDTEADKPDLKQNNEGRRENTETAAHFTQTVTDSIKEAVTQKIDAAPVSYTTSTEEIMNQVTESLKMTMKEDTTEMEMQLHPASLGSVKVQVAAKDGVITANFTTENEQVKTVLETQIVQLKEQMNEAGVKVAAVEVSVNAQAFDRNLSEQGGNRGNSEAEAKKQGRRAITLDTLDDIDDLQLNEEDRIVADMMARSGNTVDYMA